MSGLVQRNIQAQLDARRAAERRKSWGEALADRITAFAGSMRSALAHLVVFGSWILVNAGSCRESSPSTRFPS